MFSEVELRALMSEVTQHEIELFGKASANIGYATKEAIWSSLVEKVSAVGITMRTVNQVMKRRQDLRQRTKVKLATQHRHASRNRRRTAIHITADTAGEASGDDNPSQTK
ncbi:UNVERIFIED_CONTAM: hypothetical protein FKN15_066555 [Acipenser sinensis]